MPKRKQQPAADVSKGLFMDLAFLLIAALVLMVNEPAQEEVRLEKSKAEAETTAFVEKLKKLELRAPSVKEFIETKQDGDAIWLRQAEDGTIFEILPEDRGDKPVDSVSSDPELKKLKQRIQDLARPRYALLHVNPDVEYENFSMFHERLQTFLADEILDHCVEIVKEK